MSKKPVKKMSSPEPIPLGKYRGFDTELLFNSTERTYEVKLKGLRYTKPYGKNQNI